MNHIQGNKIQAIKNEFCVTKPVLLTAIHISSLLVGRLRQNDRQLLHAGKLNFRGK